MSDDKSVNDIRSSLRRQLRLAPSRSSVPTSLPVLFFGDALVARVATIGLNPSKSEYLDSSGRSWSGPHQRFATTTSLGAESREQLSDSDADRAIATMRAYFDEGKPVYDPYFRHLTNLLDGLVASYQDRSATHLDLVQEATDPVWGGLDLNERATLLDRGLPFLLWQLENLPNLAVVLCTTARVGLELRTRLAVSDFREGELKRVEWWFGTTQLGGRKLKVGGWNIPLHRPTGLGAQGEVELGRTFASQV